MAFQSQSIPMEPSLNTRVYKKLILAYLTVNLFSLGAKQRDRPIVSGEGPARKHKQVGSLPSYSQPLKFLHIKSHSSTLAWHSNSFVRVVKLHHTSSSLQHFLAPRTVNSFNNIQHSSFLVYNQDTFINQQGNIIR